MRKLSLLKALPGILLCLAPLLSLAAAWLPAAALAATYTVTKEADDDGPCEVDDCALREALLASNEDPGLDTILLPAGHYQITIPETVGSVARTGSFDIQGEVELRGEHPLTTIIMGDGLDRVFFLSAGSVVEMSNVTIAGGRTAGWGGGAYVELSEAHFRNCIVRDNESTHADGGGIGAFESIVTIDSSIIFNNRAYGDGGGIFRFGAFPTASSDMTLINTTVSGNSAFQGGGAATTSEGRLILINSTVANNTADFRVSGLFMIDTRGPIFTNTLIVGSCGFLNASGTISNGGNIESPGTNCAMHHPTDRMGIADPGIGPLVTSGGSTPSHPLLAGSPAIDAALDVACPANDQRGIGRPQDGDGDGVASCDVGAFERLPGQPPSVEIPALGSGGALVLIVLLGTAAALVLRRRRSSDGSSATGL